jgi:predicted nucleic acid-binding protein
MPTPAPARASPVWILCSYFWKRRQARVLLLQQGNLPWTLERAGNKNPNRVDIWVLQEFYVNVTRKVTNPLPTEAAAQIIADLSVWKVHSPRTEDVLDAIRLQKRYQISFWDAMILVSALKLGCNVLWPEDLNPGQVYDQVEVQSPF